MNGTQGQNDMTEMYSAIEAEVPIPADPHTQTNFEFVGDLKRAEKVIIGGQALSHCVNYTTRDLLRYWAPRDPADLILLLDGELPCVFLVMLAANTICVCLLMLWRWCDCGFWFCIIQVPRPCPAATRAPSCSWTTCAPRTSP
jgi:hypothetical protein